MPPHFPVPGADIMLDGAKLDQQLMAKLLDVEVRDNLLKPDTATFRIRDPEGALIDHASLKVGAALEIKMAAAEEQATEPLFRGEIVALEPEFGKEDCIISVRAYDRAHKLNRQRISRTFQNQTAEDMVKAVGSAAGLTPGTVESTGVVHKYFQQSMETDWEFCWRLAVMNNFEFVVQDKTFHFRKRKAESAAVTLTWGANLLGFRPRMSGLGQPSEVTVANHDPVAKQELTGSAKSPELVSKAPAANGRSSAVGSLSGGTVVVADRVVDTQAEADKLAQITLDRIASTFVEADGKAHGDPGIRAGATIKIEKVGERFSGEYVLTQTRHQFRGGNQYTTAFVISGRTDHTFSELLRSAKQGDWSSALVIGIVTNNKDPDGLGRVRVKFPALGSDIEGWWARVATINAGTERGLYMLPEVNDEVVVAFEHGDTRRPIVVGSLYHGKAKVPADLIDGKNDPKKALFGIKSDDKAHIESQQAMTLRSHEKMTVEIKRDGQGGTGDFLLDAAGNEKHKVAQSFDVQANQSVTIKGSGSVTVESSGSLQLKGATIDIQASGPVNVKGAMINLG
jgi:phage protein D/phage baseplate assembly protein gpV